jgi:ABC-2 type transport system ATP-binding protein
MPFESLCCFMISCQNLSKNYGDFAAVSGASFEVQAGSICALLGPNGAGKSTIVKMLTGLAEPSSGAATVGGVSVENAALKSIIGVLPETLALFDSLTVEEHLKLTGAAYKIRAEDVRSRAEQLLRILRLQDGKGTFIRQCSYGMKKKTALAMALLPNPRVLFLDEPFEGIDPITAETIRIQLRAIARKGVTVLLTSHILSLVDRVADQVVMIHDGRIVWNSQLSELPKSLEELYFETVEAAETEELDWLGSAAS